MISWLLGLNAARNTDEADEARQEAERQHQLAYLRTLEAEAKALPLPPPTRAGLPLPTRTRQVLRHPAGYTNLVVLAAENQQKRHQVLHERAVAAARVRNAELGLPWWANRAWRRRATSLAKGTWREGLKETSYRLTKKSLTMG